MIDAPIKAVAPFAGGKRRLAKRIVELLGHHDTYIEPFVGGCSILPVKPRSDREYVYDLNADIIDVIRHLGAWSTPHWVDYCERQLLGIVYGRESFEAARERLAVPNQQNDRPRALRVADLLTVWWMGPGGIAGTDRKPWFAQRHTKTGGCPAKRWASFVESVPAMCARLNGVCANVADGITSLEQSSWMDCAGTAIYCDPPYLAKSFRYLADFAPADHERLATALNACRRARVVVSYYDDDAGTLDRLYPPAWWRRVEVEQSKNMSAASGATGRATEVLLINDAGGR